MKMRSERGDVLRTTVGIAAVILILAVLFGVCVGSADAAPPCLHGDGAVTGTAGDDHLCGGNRKDTVSGLAGDDVLAGNHGTDVLIGGTGDDRLWGGKGPDAFDCGPGFDRVHDAGTAPADVGADCEVVNGVRAA